ncbi:MAG: hypothetical protein BGO70_01265 [Bacteroidetes bacterium 43-93]|uniref:hypothetical protein n=1 Tax=uncultured Dysgonomonas sp. TaxID=206096 RepID=UPI0009282AC6|nr:hypothetical protein [uncultured Dysgonomonas sp.]MBN9483095.1 hypothetical protein [Bacteroidota bacterium]OJW96340.1 MAG: hypothetical protein BGO70_01265 [Bacteroidetes bacterium 43-93]
MKACLALAFIILISSLGNGAYCQLQDCKNAPRGWFVIICINQTNASQIKFEIGPGGNKSAHHDWFTWKRGDPTYLRLPPDLRYAKEIWLKAFSDPQKSKHKGDVSLCICYEDHVTQKMTFDEEEEHETNRDDDNPCECQIP